MSGQRNTTMLEDEVERQTQAKWATNKEMRAEFGNDINVCTAYFQAKARGAARHVNATVYTIKPGATFKTGAQEDDDQSNKLSGDLTPQVEAVHPTMSAAEVQAIARRRRASRMNGDNSGAFQARWNADPALRGEFGGNFEAFAALERAVASGRVENYGGGS